MSPTIVDLTASDPVVTGLTNEPPNEEEVLKRAIQIAQPERLRATLEGICDSSPEAFRIARSLLLVPEEQVKQKKVDRKNRTGDSEDEDEDEDEEDSSESGDNEDDSENSDDASGEEEEEEEEDNGVAVPQTKGVKRLHSKFATCINCSEEFDVTGNGRYSCTWHPGEREPDYDADTWIDWDEDCHGRIDELEDEYPDGFLYNCCERVGDAEGCRIGTHVEEKTSYKRARY